MAVTVVIKATGEQFRGKFARIDGDRQITLFSCMTSDGRGAYSGGGKTTTFGLGEVEVLAHRWDLEIQEVPSPAEAHRTDEIGLPPPS